MTLCCFKKDCDLEVQYICRCLSSVTLCCELHLENHLNLPNRTHKFDSTSEGPCEETKDAILRFLVKEKSKKEKLKKIISTSFRQTLYNSKNNREEALRNIDFDLREISDLIKKMSQGSEQDQLFNNVISEPDTVMNENCTAKILYRLKELKTRRRIILSRVSNDQETEEDFRRINLEFASQSDPLLNKAYQEYVSSYHQITSLYFIIGFEKNANFLIYDTENEREEMKKLDFPKDLDRYLGIITQLPNGHLFCIKCIMTSDVQDFFIIDRNYEIRMMPTENSRGWWTSVIYSNRSVYCFGRKGTSMISRRFDLDKNQWFKISIMTHDRVYYDNSIAFNQNILICQYWTRNLLLYSAEIDSFSIIPYEFAENKTKILINAYERLYLIECDNGSVYESEVENEFVWQKIADSIISHEFTRVYSSYNKRGIYIATIDRNTNRMYYKFDLDRKVLLRLSPVQAYKSNEVRLPSSREL